MSDPLSSIWQRDQKVRRTKCPANNILRFFYIYIRSATKYPEKWKQIQKILSGNDTTLADLVQAGPPEYDQLAKASLSADISDFTKERIADTLALKKLGKFDSSTNTTYFIPNIKLVKILNDVWKDHEIEEPSILNFLLTCNTDVPGAENLKTISKNVKVPDDIIPMIESVMTTSLLSAEIPDDEEEEEISDEDEEEEDDNDLDLDLPIKKRITRSTYKEKQHNNHQPVTHTMPPTEMTFPHLFFNNFALMDVISRDLEFWKNLNNS